MRASVVMLCCALAGFLGGAALIGLAALGASLMFVSLAVAWYALSRDDGTPVPQVHGLPSTLHDILERARAS